MDLTFDDAILERVPGIRMGISIIRDVTVRPSGGVNGGSASDPVAEEMLALRSGMTEGEVLRAPEITAMRNLYWRLGTDPTKTRPSAEALLRMFLAGGTIHRINNIVDATNIGSLRFLLPTGSYDLGKIKGDLSVRFSRERETYRPIGTKLQSLRERIIVVADDEKVICAGYASSDSDITKIISGTRDVALLVYAPRETGPEHLFRATEWTAGFIGRLGKGNRESLRLFGGEG